MKKEKRCLPLEITNKVSEKYPGCWELVKTFRDGKSKGDLQWDDLCYIPIAATIAITSNGESVSLETVGDASILAAVAPWRLYKQIYSFPEEMERLLFEQADDCKLPVDVLRNLPYPCIYVEIHTEESMNGFFFHFESDDTVGLEMRFLFLMGSEDIYSVPFSVHVVPDGTIKDGIDESLKLMRKNARKEGMESEIADMVNKLSFKDFSVIYKCIQLVLYICAQNREIAEDEVQKRIYRKPKSEEYIKDKYREVQKWNMGTETAQIIRKMNRNPVRYQYSGESSGTGTSKSPHVRRGHWHHFWVGKRNGERKQILKWIPPTFVNADKVDEADTITRNIVYDKENGNQK